jgi:formiminotetrahydrofolate cyclodeaminase
MTLVVDSLNDYLTKLASEAPIPGGGSAAMLVGAAACSLCAMVARICAESKKYVDVRPTALRLAAQADALRDRMALLRAQDEAAFEAVVAARGDKEAMQAALRGAAQAPLEGAGAAFEALQLAGEAFDLRNANLVSDAGCAAEFAYAALLACAYNVRINHKFMKDADLVQTQAAELDRLENEGAALLSALRRGLQVSFTAKKAP